MKNNSFKVLNLKEEDELTKEELIHYYKELREYLSDRKLTNTTPLATKIGPKLKKITSKISVPLTKALAGKDYQKKVEGLENIPDCPAIFGFNHSGILDNFAWMEDMKRHCLILHGADAKAIVKAIQLNTGLILVDKNGNNKEDTQNAKLDMMELLIKGHSIVYFPESTWNLSPNKLLLPIRYGIIDIARKTGKPIVPSVMEYTYDLNSKKEKVNLIHIKYGKPIYVKENDNLQEKLDEYNEAMSTLLWECYEEKGVFERENIKLTDYKTFINQKLESLKFGGINIDRERENILGASSDFYQFHHINDIPVDEEGKMIDTEEVQKIKKINKIHNI